MAAQLLDGIVAAVFDAVGTLIVPNPPAHLVYADCALRHGILIPPNEVRQRFVAAFQGEEEVDRREGWRTGEDRETLRWRRIVSMVLNSNDQAIFDELWEYFAKPSSWTVLPEVSHTLQVLAQRQLKLGIATNFDRRLYDVMAGFPELAPISCHVISSEVGWRKPAPQFFDAVVRTVGCLRQEILFVGDDRINDYDGARASGLRAVLVDATGQACGGDVISTLKELR